MDDYLALLDYSFLELIGSNPFAAMWFIIAHGGWIVFAYMFVMMTLTLWKGSRQSKFEATKQWMVLSINVPKNTEQTPRAVENIFAHLAGAHGPNSWTEEWIDGRTQDTISLEIISIDGRVQFLIRTTRGFRDLVEASIYAQYPDAEIVEVEDYAHHAPHHFPDKEWDMFGTELIPVRKDSHGHALDMYPIRTYPEFEDKVSGEFKDPLAVLLENMSRLRPGEQAWFQIVLTPVDQKDFRARGEEMVKKLSGKPIPPKKPGIVEQILGFPFKIIGLFLEGLGIVPPASPKKKEDDPFGQVMRMTPGERRVLEAVENKISKIVYLSKMRFIYLAKKEIMNKKIIVNPIIGFIKQFNTNDMMAFKPESKKVGMNGTLWWFKSYRNNQRKNRLMGAYSHRSNHSGTHDYHLNTEELATLWHFPISMQVKAPQLRKTESKRSEPPINLPFAP